MEEKENKDNVVEVKTAVAKQHPILLPGVWDLFKEGASKSFRLWDILAWNVLASILAVAFFYLIFILLIPVDASGNLQDLSTVKPLLQIGISILLFAVILFFMTRVYAASIYAVTAKEGEESTSFIVAWKKSAPSAWTFIGLGFLSVFIWYCTVWFLWIPAVAIFIFTWLAMPHVLHDKSAAFKALLYSTHITQRHWWAVFGRLLAVNLLWFLTMLVPLLLLVFVLIAAPFLSDAVKVIDAGGTQLPPFNPNLFALILLGLIAVQVLWSQFVITFHTRGRLYWELKAAQPAFVDGAYKKTRILYIVAAIIGAPIAVAWLGFNVVASNEDAEQMQMYQSGQHQFNDAEFDRYQMEGGEYQLSPEEMEALQLQMREAGFEAEAMEGEMMVQ